MKFNEEKLKKIAEPYFIIARAGDWKHAFRVVKWVKKLGKCRSDLYLLITAAYIHDIGWSGVAPKGKIDLDEMLKLERKANKNSSRLISEVLEKLRFTNLEIKVVKRLVAAADKHKSQQEDEAIIVDADSLSKLCIEHLEQKYQPDSFCKVIDLYESRLSKRIKTRIGKELFPEMLRQLKQEILLKEYD